MDTTIGLVLAAGKGTRMKSKLYKVLHPICGKPMIGHVIDALEKANCARKVVVVGHGADAVKAYLGDRAEYVMQSSQMGTGHAVMQAKSLLEGISAITLITCGDTPLITASTIKQLIQFHRERNAAATILTAKLDQPQGYGRVIRDQEGSVSAIVEEKDCTDEQRKVNEINTATYCFDNTKLFRALEKINNNNKQQEYYLTDVISILKQQGESIQAYCLEDHEEAIGVNDRVALAEAENIMQLRILRQHALSGVTIKDPSNTYIEADVQIGMDTVIYPGTILSGSTVIGEDCQIGPNTQIVDSTIGNGVQVMHSMIQQSTIADASTIGPFANIRAGSQIGRQVRIGDFVEVKNSTLDEGVKVAHLSYVGDATVGKNVNIGCGVVTVNYDGYHKHRTIIEDEAFVGSNVNLIAPVTIGKRAYVVAGSTITKDVKENEMAIARERQTNKPGYADMIRKKILQRSNTNSNRPDRE